MTVLQFNYLATANYIHERYLFYSLTEDEKEDDEHKLNGWSFYESPEDFNEIGEIL